MSQDHKPWAVALPPIHPEDLMAPDGTHLMTHDQVGALMDEDMGQGAWAWVQENCASYKIEYEYLPDSEIPCVVPWLVLSEEGEAWTFKFRFQGVSVSWDESRDEPWARPLGWRQT